MHGVGKYKIDNPKKRLKEFLSNIQEINEKCESDILEQLPLKLPSVYGKDSNKIFKKAVNFLSFL
jgi:hypothetical protein